MRENNNMNNTCRLCLAKVDETQSIEIFPKTYLNGVSLVMKIMVCVSLTIQEGDPFPKKICKDCEESVNTFYSFREACSRSYFTLIQNFGESKDPVGETESIEYLPNPTCVQNSGSNAQPLPRIERCVLKNEFKSILPVGITEPSLTGDENCGKFINGEDNEENKNCTNDFDLERNIPQHHIVCLETENHSIQPREELFCQENILSRSQDTEDPEIDSKSMQKLKSKKGVPEVIEELGSTVNGDSLAAYNFDLDCYQVEEIRDQVLCGKQIKERVRYKCLRCQNSFNDLDSVTAHYTDYCQPVDRQQAEWASAGSSNGEGGTNYLDTYEYSDGNFELETNQTSSECSNNDQTVEDVDFTHSSDISELKEGRIMEENQRNHRTKRDLARIYDFTSPCNSTIGVEGSVFESKKSCNLRIEETSTKSQLITLGRTRKRKGRWLGKIEHPCPECDRIFTSSSLLKRHSLVHTGERPHVCEVCNRRFTQLGQLNFHRKFHNNPRYRCHICSKPFLRPSDIEKHMRTHTGEKPYDCKICLKAFAQLGALQQHSRIHSGEKPYSCEICGKRFSQKANKTKHVKIHKEGERPHTCYICGRSFSELSEMELHRAGHGGGRPRKCDYCDDSFRKLSELNHHVRRFHTFERQHKCMFCPKEFYSIYNLKQHVMVHTGQRPYACSKCDLRFTQKGNLTKHFERKHSESIEKKNQYILVAEKSFDEQNLRFVDININVDDPDDELIVEREETIESQADINLKRNRV